MYPCSDTPSIGDRTGDGRGRRTLHGWDLPGPLAGIPACGRGFARRL